MLNNQNVYLVICEGQGDTEIKLINEEAWNWMLSPFDDAKGEYSYNEDVPESILKTFNCSEPKSISVSCRSYENDRALQMPGMSFSSVADVHKYLNSNNCEIVDEYYGCIY